MNGSWKIGTISGIGVFVHWTFTILLAWIVLTHFMRGDDFWDAVHGIVFVVALFGIIVLHELGHALAARRYGISTKDITLLPIGGVARLERMPEDPKQELVVALAGPAVNVALAGLCLALMIGLSGISSLGDDIGHGVGDLGFVVENNEDVAKISENSFLGAEFLSKLLIVNVMLVLFNMLPAFPMDGGRVLRALLAMNMDYVNATQIAASVGQAIAILFGFLGLFFNPFLVFIALFVWMGAASEASMVQLKSGLQGIPASTAMITDYQTVGPNDTLADAAHHVISGFQYDFPVQDQDGRVVGVLTKTDLIKSLTERGAEEPVGNVMRRDFETARPTDMLHAVFLKLQGCQCHTIPIIDRERLLGLVTMENVGEFLAIQDALKRNKS